MVMVMVMAMAMARVSVIAIADATQYSACTVQHEVAADRCRSAAGNDKQTRAARQSVDELARRWQTPSDC